MRLEYILWIGKSCLMRVRGWGGGGGGLGRDNMVLSLFYLDTGLSTIVTTGMDCTGRVNRRFLRMYHGPGIVWGLKRTIAGRNTTYIARVVLFNGGYMRGWLWAWVLKA